jgi:hypothetical protein
VKRDSADSPFLDRDKLNGFYDEVHKLARKKFPQDSDGDVPIDISIIDRTRYERMHYFHIPYDSKISTPEEWNDLLGALVGNLQIASEGMNRWHRCLKYHPCPAIIGATDKHLSDENRQLVERNKTIENELNVMRREHAVQIRKDEAVKSARTKRNEATEALDHLWHCEIADCEDCEDHKKRHRLEGKKPDKKKS